MEKEATNSCWSEIKVNKQRESSQACMIAKGKAEIPPMQKADKNRPSAFQPQTKPEQDVDLEGAKTNKILR